MTNRRFSTIVFIGILVIVLGIASQFWVPVFIIPLGQEPTATIEGYFAAAKEQDAATAIKFLAYPGSGTAAVAKLADTLNLLKGFYDIEGIEFKDRYYVLPKALGQLIWVECTTSYDDGKEWDIDLILLRTEEGWRIDSIMPALEARRP